MKVSIETAKRKAIDFAHNLKTQFNDTVIKTKTVLADDSGQLLADHAGWVAVSFVLIGVVLYFTYPMLKTTLLPALQKKVMDLINYNG